MRIDPMYVDDSINAGNEAFQIHTFKSLDLFESKPSGWDHFNFYGLQISRSEGYTKSMSQPYYTKNFRATQINSIFETFPRDRALLTWLTHFRPHLCLMANRAAQATSKTFGPTKVRELNKSVCWAKRSEEKTFWYDKLYIKSLHLRTYSDAAFATNGDLSSQLGYIILPADSSNRCHILHYASKKSNHVYQIHYGRRNVRFHGSV